MLPDPPSSIPKEVDVIVFGAGPAGVVAAVQAARAGASTLLVEKSGVLGGTTVLNGVNLPGLFHAWGKQVIAGIGWELVTRAVSESGGTLPDFTNFRNVPHNRLQILLDKAVYAAVCDDAVVGSGATLLLHAMLARLERASDRWRATICTKEGLADCFAGVVVDCTGDANAVQLAGGALDKNDALQPATLMLLVGGYDLASVDLPFVQQAFDHAVESGQMLRADLQHASHAVHHFF